MRYKMLKIDLTSRTSQELDLGEENLGLCLGGRGLGARLLWDEMKGGVDPLGPENKVFFSVGPLQGTNTFFSSKCILSTKSPLTDIYLYTAGGGTFGINLARSGYMSLAIEGASEDPVYVNIRNGKVEFRDASAIWGTRSAEAQELVLEEIRDPKAAVAAIGPAGERLVRFAAVVTGGNKRRTFSRGGGGAVMGAKKLKAIAISGDQPAPVANPQLLRETMKGMSAKLSGDKMAEMMRTYGTPYQVESLSLMGMLPTRNWQSGVFEKAQDICTLYVGDRYTVKSVPCGPYCPMPCGKIRLVKDGPYAGTITEGPEFDTVYGFGSSCGVGRFDAVIAADRLCDELGMDSISCGVAIGFGMECFEKGIVTSADTDGVQLSFGNDAAVLEFIRKIGYREGLGNLLAEGVKRASRTLGHGSESFAMHAKGMEFGGYEARGAKGQALQYAMGSRGGCHHSLGLPALSEMRQGNDLSTEGKGALLKEVALGRIVYDCAVMCTFSRSMLGFDLLAQAVSAVSGVDMTADDVRRIGERVLTLERAFSVREGIRREDDTLPGRLLEEAMPDGPTAGAVVAPQELEVMKDQFYREVGWDRATGIPTRQELERLGLGRVMQALSPRCVPEGKPADWS